MRSLWGIPLVSELQTKQYSFLVSQSYLGSQKFDFDGQGKDLMKSFLLSLLCTLPTLGLCWFWFMAAKKRYLINHTSFGTARFHSTMTGRNLFFLYAWNLFLLLFTAGFSYPWVLVRNYQFAYRYMTCEGPLPLEGIKQESFEASSTGEGLDSLMDINPGFSIA